MPSVYQTRHRVGLHLNRLVEDNATQRIALFRPHKFDVWLKFRLSEDNFKELQTSIFDRTYIRKFLLSKRPDRPVASIIDHV